MSNEVTTTESFEPTPAMKVWVDTTVKTMNDNVSEISEACNVSRQSWYRWMRDDDFREWFRDEWNKAMAGVAWKLDVIGLRQAETDFRYWHAMQIRVGNIMPNGVSNIQPQKQYVFSLPERIPVAFKA